ncbi:phosphate signaling complex protein PhoU [Parasphaerochaeta coccoides]|uniref:Phosphate-specific transport system accessory protein PhoU n=1 Tax=Parasphaerochaeta coccoides (strain ATCC BAA-1237 / DSM 17374 / SPN1) TaxID=760011 RepID=F4GIF9_PARC1|nr:phosphate signaling complex protein PhoU [Parasphaerochaeta coccoides]AEC01667.1 phosphate uptake regulator, PhoU [Parasphaerochaeta coccoides DSM 17374]
MMVKKHQLDDKMTFFNELLIQMVNRVEGAIYQAVHAFKEHDQELAKKVVSDDYFINQLRDMIESDGVRLLISEAPYGQYMRTVIAGMKIVTSLERMGDHAAHLARLALLPTGQFDDKKIVEEMSAMALIGARMTRSAVEALVANDQDKARAVALIDDEMDAKRKQVNGLIYNVETKSREDREKLYDYFYVTKELERLGDHVTTICSWIVYTAAGVKPKLN